MNEPTNGQTDLDAVLERISPDKREAFLRSRLRLKQFSENDEFLAIASYLDNFSVLIDGLTKNLGANTNGARLPAIQDPVPGVDHLVHYNEMSSAFERLTTLVQEQQKALVKLNENDDKIFRKVCLFVEGQPAHQLAQWVWWLGSCLVLLILGVVFYLGFSYGADAVQAQANARADNAVAMAQEAITANNHYRLGQPLPSPGR